MKRISTLCILILSIALSGSANPPGNGPTGKQQLPDQHSFKTQTALSFIENKGQITDQYGKTRTDIDFKIEGGGVNVFIGAGKMHYQWVKPLTSPANLNSHPASASDTEQQQGYSLYRMDVELLDADPNAQVITEAKQAFFEQYFTEQGVTRANSYHKVTYKDVYPNIDWVFYFNTSGQLEHDFVVHPGGDPADIQIRYGGTTDLSINRDGSLTATTPLGRVTEAAPYSFTESGAPVVSSFVLQNDKLSFKTAPYTGTLTIDPSVVWATYYGGDTADDNFFIITRTNAMAVDATGNVFLGGSTNTLNNIATTGSHQEQMNTSTFTMYLAKFNTNGERLWATYYGNGSSSLYDLTCDANGNVYFAGDTRDALPGFSTPGAHQEQLLAAIPQFYNGFLIKFNGTGERQWATYYGGPEGHTKGMQTSCDPWGNVYLYGHTSAETHIATAGTHKASSPANSKGDAFLVKFDSAGTRLWGTYYGGTDKETIQFGDGDANGGLACDAAGNVFIAGATISRDGIAFGSNIHQDTFSMAHYDPSLGYVLAGYDDAFLAKFDSAGQVIWGTYYGGAGAYNPEGWKGWDYITDLSTDAAGNVFVVGGTGSDNGIATPGAYKEMPLPLVPASSRMPFIAKFNGDGEQQWGTYFGEKDSVTQPMSTNITRTAVDAAGNLWVVGKTNSRTGFATSNGLYTTFTSSTVYEGSVFIVKLNPADGYPIWGSYYGGLSTGEKDIACDPWGNLYLAYTTNADGWATPGSHQDTFLQDATIMASVVKFEDCDGVIDSISTPAIFGDTLVCPGAELVYRVSDIGADAYDWTLPSGWSGNSTSDSITVIAGETGGDISVAAVLSCGNTAAQSLTVDLYPVHPPTIQKTDDQLHAGADYVHYQWYLNGDTLAGATDSLLAISENGDYTVVVTDENGCVTSDTLSVGDLAVVSPEVASRIRIFPNPANDVLNIDAPFAVNLTLCNIEGKVLNQYSNVHTLDVSALAEGYYLLKIADKSGRLITVEKFIKLKR